MGPLMEIMVNGKKEIIENEMTIIDYLKSKDLNPDVVIVEYNKKIIDKAEYGAMVIKDKDKLEILRFVGGG